MYLQCKKAYTHSQRLILMKLRQIVYAFRLKSQIVAELDIFGTSNVDTASLRLLKMINKVNDMQLVKVNNIINK